MVEPAGVSERTPVYLPTETPTEIATPDEKASTLSFVQARPNVSNGVKPIRIHSELNRAARLTLSIFRLNGKLLYSSQVDGSQGSVDLTWDVRSSGGGRVASGLYVYTLQAQDPTGERKDEIKKGKILICR
jgi:hypothetical protein